MSRVRRERPERFRRLKRVCFPSLHPSSIPFSRPTQRGDIALLRNADFHDRASRWSLERVWTGHHKGVVRSALLDERVSPANALFVRIICRHPLSSQANVLLTGGEDAHLLAWSCAPLPKEENGMAVDGSSSPPVLAKRDHEGDVEMSHLSPENASRTISLII
jgi:hypothetical protein